MLPKRCLFALSEQAKGIYTSNTESAPIERYRHRVSGYKTVERMKREKECSLARKGECMYVYNKSIYIGAWTGEVFVYDSGSCMFQERFRACPSQVKQFSEYENTLLILHSNGKVTTLQNKTGVSSTVEGFISGIFHSFLPYALSKTNNGFSVYDLAGHKEIARAQEINGIPVSVHAYGAGVLVKEKEGYIMDIRTMKKEAVIPNSKHIISGLFHSSGIELILGASSKKIKVIDTRNINDVIYQHRPQKPAEYLYEYKGALLYSPADAPAQAICPNTGKYLYRFPTSISAFSAGDNALFACEAPKTLAKMVN